MQNIHSYNRHRTSYALQELLSILDRRTLRPVNVLGLLVFDNKLHKERY